MRQGYAEVNGTKLFYEVQGTGAPLVLVHSGLIDSRMWDAQMTAFAERFQVIRYDVRGHGRSGRVMGPYADVEDLQGLLQALGLTRVHLLGLSMGGRIVSDFAIAHPECVEKLVLTASALSGYQMSPEAKADPDQQRAYDAFHELQKGNRERAVEMLLNTPKWRQTDPAAHAQLREMFLASDFVPWLQSEQVLQLQPPAAERLKEIQAPTLLIVGTGDSVAILEIADLMEGNIADVRKVVLSGLGHLPNLEQQETFNRLVLEFLGG